MLFRLLVKVIPGSSPVAASPKAGSSAADEALALVDPDPDRRWDVAVGNGIPFTDFGLDGLEWLSIQPGFWGLVAGRWRLFGPIDPESVIPIGAEGSACVTDGGEYVLTEIVSTDVSEAPALGAPRRFWYRRFAIRLTGAVLPGGQHLGPQRLNDPRIRRKAFLDSFQSIKNIRGSMHAGALTRLRGPGGGGRRRFLV
jgi:hypothetical protein